MAQDMPLPVLADKVPQIGPQTHVRDGGFAVAPLLHGEALEEDEPLPVEEFGADAAGEGGHVGQGEGGLGDARQGRAGDAEGVGGGAHFGEFGRGEVVGPSLGVVRVLVGGPDGGAGDLGGEGGVGSQFGVEGGVLAGCFNAVWEDGSGDGLLRVYGGSLGRRVGGESGSHDFVSSVRTYLHKQAMDGCGGNEARWDNGQFCLAGLPLHPRQSNPTSLYTAVHRHR